MESYYHKTLGMINNTPENRELLIKLGHIKIEQDDLTPAEPTEQSSPNIKRVSKSKRSK